MKAAIYARYSGDRQRETSIDDQVRNCTRYAEREGVEIGDVYQDKAITGAVKARPGYQGMLSAAEAGCFEVLLVDDLSRLSRDDYEMKGVLRKFAWQGLRVIGVTDGYDSARKGHKIHAGFKGLMNEMFLDDLRDRTHRGMTGQALKGFNCGGRTYGYRNIPIEDPERRDAYGRPAIIAVRYEIDPEQADIVRRIYAWYAAGRSYRWIACELNRMRVPSSRASSWAQTAIKVILENEMYQGMLIWNRRQWVKHPDTGKRTYKERPPEEWIVKENPELRIVTTDVIEVIKGRQADNRKAYSAIGTNLNQRYLFSGILVCAQCAGNFIMAAKGRYGCASHKMRGPDVCNNNITVSRHIVEERILQSVKQQLLEPGNLEEFKRAAVALLEQYKADNSRDDLRRQLRDAQRTRENIMAAIKQGIVTTSTREALVSAERDIQEMAQQLEQLEHCNIASILPRAVERYQQAVEHLTKEFDGHICTAREILKSVIGETIRIHRRGDHLEAEIPNNIPAVLAKTLNLRFDSGGCGGRI